MSAPTPEPAAAADRGWTAVAARPAPRHGPAADTVVTKPGGVTCSEALALRRPLLLTRAIPGHEEANARVLHSAGVALDGSEPGRLARSLRTALDDPALLRTMRTAAGRVGSPHAAENIAVALWREFHLRDVA